MTLKQRLIARLYRGLLKRPFRAFIRRILDNEQVYTGSLNGAYFEGGLAQTLGIYELHIQSLLEKILDEGMIFYDVGANNGFFSLLAAKQVGKEGIVYAFEPFPANIKRIKRVIERNGVDNIEVVEVALSDFYGNTELYVGDSLATPTIDPTTHSLMQSIEVQVTTLDQFCSIREHPNLVKIDVEGAEVKVLEGASKFLQSDVAPNWVIELHNETCEKGVCKILKDHNYVITKIAAPHSKVYPFHIWARSQG
jgi:FkbM family methyltransferase